MEVCCSEQVQDDAVLASTRSNLRLTDDAIAYGGNAEDAEYEPSVLFQPSVDAPVSNCRCQPATQQKTGMSLSAVDDDERPSNSLSDEQCSILLSSDVVTALPEIPTEQTTVVDDVGKTPCENNSVVVDDLVICAPPTVRILDDPTPVDSVGDPEAGIVSEKDSSSTDVGMPAVAVENVVVECGGADIPSDWVADSANCIDRIETSTDESTEICERIAPDGESASTDGEIQPIELAHPLVAERDIPAVRVEEEVQPGDVVAAGQNNEEEATGDDNKKKSYRVRFNEHHVVTSYHEAPLPWKDADMCSTNELMSAYRNSCRLMAVKPLNKIVQQLEAITNFDERHELLSLRGENIDLKVCETLEEVFRRVRFRSIDIESTSMDEDTAVTMFDLLDYYESCQRLNISFNKNLGIRGWQACARFMKKTACLDMLEARGCSFNDPAMTMMGRSLRLGSIVKSLHLENCFLSGRPMMLLVAAIKFNEMLRELFLADNKLTPSDGVQLGSLLKANRSLSLLDVRNNLLQDVGLNHMCDGLSEQTSATGLNTLVVWNNQVTYESMINVGRALGTVVNLETINLGHNNITNEGIHRLKDGLLHNKSLLRIGLQSAKISCEGAVALAEYIAETNKLLRLDLRGNHIRTGGLMALTLSLKVNQTVTRLDLDQEPKKEAGIRDYAEQQRRLLGDIALYTARNLSILAGTANSVSLSPSNSNSQLVDAEQLTPPPAPPQRPTLVLPTIDMARTESLESPAYVPLTDSVASPITEAILCIDAVDSAPLGSCPAEPVVGDAVAQLAPADSVEKIEVIVGGSAFLSNITRILSPSDELCAVGMTQLHVTITPSGPDVGMTDSLTGSSDSDTAVDQKNQLASPEKPPPPAAAALSEPVVEATPKSVDAAPVASGLSTKFAAVRRKFTVSKATLPSPPLPVVKTASTVKAESSAPVVMFKKITSPTDNEQGDEDTAQAQVCFQSHDSNKDAARKEPASESDNKKKDVVDTGGMQQDHHHHHHHHQSEDDVKNPAVTPPSVIQSDIEKTAVVENIPEFQPPKGEQRLDGTDTQREDCVVNDFESPRHDNTDDGGFLQSEITGAVRSEQSHLSGETVASQQAEIIAKMMPSQQADIQSNIEIETPLNSVSDVRQNDDDVESVATSTDTDIQHDFGSPPKAETAGDRGGDGLPLVACAESQHKDVENYSESHGESDLGPQQTDKQPVVDEIQPNDLKHDLRSPPQSSEEESVDSLHVPECRHDESGCHELSTPNGFAPSSRAACATDLGLKSNDPFSSDVSTACSALPSDVSSTDTCRSVGVVLKDGVL